MATLDDRLYDLSFEVDTNIRYHDRLRSRYRRVESVSTWLTIVLGSAVVVNLLGTTGPPSSLPSFLTAIVVVTQAAGFAYRISESLGIHNSLYRQFVMLRREIARVGNPDDADLERWNSMRQDIESMEPPLKELTMLKANNDILRMRGTGTSDPEWNILGWWQERLTPFMEGSASRVRQRKDLSEEELVKAKPLDSKGGVL